jgi:hypothetical protein
MQAANLKASSLTGSRAIQAGTCIVAADEVGGTIVYSRNGGKLGMIDRLLIDKVSGKIAYVVMSSTDVTATGQQRRALPWSVLAYDPLVGGYVVNLDRKVYDNGLTFERDDGIDWNSMAWQWRLHDYYRVPPFWV